MSRSPDIAAAAVAASCPRAAFQYILAEGHSFILFIQKFVVT
jgi:hypothetical protein